MFHSGITRSTLKELLHFSAPMIFGNLGHILLGTSEITLAGHYNTQTLAALGLATGLLGPLLMIGIGLMTLSPLLSQMRGEGKNFWHLFPSCLSYSLAVALFVLILTALTIALLPYLGFPVELLALIKRYMFINTLSYPLLFIYLTMKEFLQANEQVFVPNLLAILSVPFNLILAYPMMFGWGVVPEMGISGLALAIVLTRLLMTAILYRWFCRQLPREEHLEWINGAFIKQVLLFTIPIALGIFLECSAFGGVTILIGQMAPVQSAAHSIVLNLTTLTFMVPLAIGAATSVKVGFYWGEKSARPLKSYMTSGLLLSALFMGCAGLLFALMPGPLLALFSNDPVVIQVAIPLLAMAAIFQLFDGLQVTLSGILRGLGKSVPTFIAILLGYWVIGLPLGHLLSTHFHMASQGLWAGLATAIVVIAALLAGLLIFYWHRLFRPLCDHFKLR